jgi:hypothetical protein
VLNGFYVAFLSHGVADTSSKPLKVRDSNLEVMPTEKAASEGGLTL